MNYNLIVLCLTSLLLIGCRGEKDNVTFPPVTPAQPAAPGAGPDGVIMPGLESTPDDPAVEGEGPDPVPLPTIMRGSLNAAGMPVQGEVTCAGELLDEFGQFSYRPGETVTCDFGSVPLLNISTTAEPGLTSDNEGLTVFDVINNPSLNTDKVRQGAMALLASVDVLPGDDKLTLLAAYSNLIAPLYGKPIDDRDIQTYLAGSQEEQTDKVDKAPSSHVDASVVPVVTPGTSNDISKPDGFISASAESSYRYQPSAEAQMPITSHLTDANGRPIAGVAYFTASSRGVTGADGAIEHKWGETITLGIDTFVFGEVQGNQLTHVLSDVSDNELVKQNIQTLTERYATSTGEGWAFTDKVHQVFARYPNAINEIINVALPNGTKLEGTDFSTPNEFTAQFEHGLAALIDEELAQPTGFRFYHTPATLSSAQELRAELAALYAGVDEFHIFHNIGSFYGASGYAQLMRNLPISNRASPLLMPRSDKNFWLKPGEEQVWQANAAPYLLDGNLLKEPRMSANSPLSRPPLVSAENMSFGLPGVSTGEIGKGKVVFMGNVMYPSVLSCPDSFWASRQLSIKDKQCHYNDGSLTPANDPTQSPMYDRGNMARFMLNLFTWLHADYQKGVQPLQLGTNITSALKFDHGHQSLDLNRLMYPFFIDSRFNIATTPLDSGSYAGLNPNELPVLLLQSYEVMGIANGYEVRTLSDIRRPILTTDDVNDLISYVNRGGNIVFMDAIAELNPEPIAKLADSAGIALGGHNVAQGITRQAYCGNGHYCQGNITPNARGNTPHDLVTFELIDPKELTSEYVTVNQDGTLTWHKIPKVAVAKYEVEKNNNDGSTSIIAKDAFIQVKDHAEKQAAIAELQAAFPNAKVCSDSYQYEIGCIDVRDGHGITSAGNYVRPNFTRYTLGEEVLAAMVKAADLGTNLNKLHQHEVYYRSKAKAGTRLSAPELQQTYDNVSVWMWNDEPYRYEAKLNDELGFKTLVEYLNCYTNDQHGGNSPCGEALRTSLITNKMLHENGELNPSYPINYQEKPLTRIMLGRAYWDHEIKVDTTAYPGRPTTSSAESASVNVHTYRNPVSGLAGNMQSTGLWAPQHGEVTVSGGVPSTITVGLVDDLTGRAKHEVALQRPPRVTKTFKHDGGSTRFKVPFGGLIYISPQASNDIAAISEYSFSGVMKASFWQDDGWKHPVNTDVPLAEIDTGHLIYTTPVNNVTGTDIPDFVHKMNVFAEETSNFYGRDETEATGNHRRFTSDALPGHRHRFVNDIQISIGSAHSGYPVQHASFQADRTTIPTVPDNDWLLWHEIGHNLAVAPLVVEGSTEVTNNVLALYMQELRPVPNNKMGRIELDIQKMPLLLAAHHGHLWSEGDAGVRLVMFGQLKLWAEQHFSIDDWYAPQYKPTIFGDDQGWNLFKLMHRKARGDNTGDNNGTNYCSSRDTDLQGGDLLMVCSSYVSGYDLSGFFKAWNPGEVKTVYPGGSSYSGGISSKGLLRLAELKLPAPASSPDHISNLSGHRTY